MTATDADDDVNFGRELLDALRDVASAIRSASDDYHCLTLARMSPDERENYVQRVEQALADLLEQGPPNQGVQS